MNKHILLLILLWMVGPPLVADAQIIKKSGIMHTYIEKATEEYERGNWESGKTVVEEGLKKQPHDSELHRLLGRYYHRRGAYDKARYELKKALEINPNNVEALHLLVDVETRTERYSSAICYVNELLEHTPYWRGLWRTKIKLYRLQKNHVEADRLLKRALQVFPNDTLLMNAQRDRLEEEALEQRKKGMLEKSIDTQKMLLDASPTNPDFYRDIADTYIKSGDLTSALAQVEQGLYYNQRNGELVRKKVAILAEQRRYQEVLSYLQRQMQETPSPIFSQLYNYYLGEAAQYAKDSRMETLYGKIFERNPGDEVAFNHHYNDLVTQHQYDEALAVLRRHRTARGNTKPLAMRELSLYKLMGRTAHAEAFTRELYRLYPDDADLRDAYLQILYRDAQSKIAENRFADALPDLQELLLQMGDNKEYQQPTLRALSTIYAALGDEDQLLLTFDQMLRENPSSPDVHAAKAEALRRIGRLGDAFAAYEQAIALAPERERKRYRGGYGEFMTAVAKEQSERYQHNAAMGTIQRWLAIDPESKEALMLAVTYALRRGDQEGVLYYAQRGEALYPNELHFKLQRAALGSKNPQAYAALYNELLGEVRLEPYHEPLLRTFESVGDHHGQHLLKAKQPEAALAVANEVLHYLPESRLIKYMKGLAYEQLKQPDSAHYYQSFHDPSLLEEDDFKKHMDYLAHRSHRNQVGYSYQRNRWGDRDVLSTLSTVEYTRIGLRNSYTGRVQYAGREDAKGFQIQGEWSRTWGRGWSSRLDAAWSTRFFPRWAFNGVASKETSWWGGMGIDAGLGFRYFSDGQTLGNLLVGVNKEFEAPFSLGARLQNYLLGGRTWLYNLSGQARYYLGHPKTAILAMASVGTSPDIELLENQLLNKFAVSNMMVGAGFTYLLTSTVDIAVIGSWYNYQVSATAFSNLYNLHVSTRIVF